MSVRLEIRSDFACFTMPEWKVERMSYPIPTPSAARNIVQAIFWRPAIQWQVLRIKLLNPIQYMSIKTNELVKKISLKKCTPVDITRMGKDRTQRMSVILRDAAFEIEVEPVLTPKGIRDKEHPQKFINMLLQRVKKGQHFSTPYMGIREHTAYVSLANGSKPVDVNMDLGQMFFDRYYADDRRWKTDPNNEKWAHNIPFFFPAQIVSGVLEVPSRKAVMGEYA